jgi:hypothetical protein
MELINWVYVKKSKLPLRNGYPFKHRNQHLGNSHDNNPRTKTGITQRLDKEQQEQLFYELETEYGFPRATCRSLVQLMQEFIEEKLYKPARRQSDIIYHAVSKDEPPGSS